MLVVNVEEILSEDYRRMVRCGDCW